MYLFIYLLIPNACNNFVLLLISDIFFIMIVLFFFSKFKRFLFFYLVILCFLGLYSFYVKLKLITRVKKIVLYKTL